MSTYQIGDYRQTYASFRLTRPERYNWAFDVFDRWAGDPGKLAMRWVSDAGNVRKVTFREFSRTSTRFANALSGLAVEPGERVFVMLPRVVEWWEVLLGGIRARVVTVPGTTLLRHKDIVYRINASGASVAVTDAANADRIEAVRPECPRLRHVIVVGGGPGCLGYEDLLAKSSPSMDHPRNLSTDPLMIYFTSGTTGPPKMVLNDHASYPKAHVITGKFWLDNRPTDLHWTLSDTGWAQAAWTCLFAPWNMGAAIFIWDHRGRFDAERTLRMLHEHPITTFFAPPTAYRMLVQQDLTRWPARALRHCLGAGEAVNPEVIATWKGAMGHHIWEGYGQTETVLCVATFPGMEYRPGSMGVASPGFRMGVVDDSGNEVAPGQEGEIAIRVRPDRPLGLFCGYYRNPEATASCFVGDWYTTGDRATRDEDGYFYFVSRTDDVINTSAYRVGPFEVESALLEHPAVAEVAVVGSPDQLRGEIIKAFVVLGQSARPSEDLIRELQAHVRNVTAPYKYPREMEFIDELPKTISGKIRRNELRRWELEKKGR